MMLTLGSLFDEHYKPFPLQGYKEHYLVSNLGTVKSLRTGKILKPETDDYGYLVVTVSVKNNRKTMKVHRLVAMAFIENEQNKSQEASAPMTDEDSTGRT